MLAEDTSGNAMKKSDAEPADRSSKAPPFWRRLNWRILLTRRGLVVAMGVSVALFGLIFIYCLTIGPRGYRSPEVSLGTYEFQSQPDVIAPIARATFDLHVALLTEVDSAARLRLFARRYRIQQDVEQLLRQAQGGDFEDPTLAELKRQLQEQINETLDMRAIAEVIVTDLQIVRGEGADPSASPASAAHVEASSPWREMPPSTVATGP